MAEPDPPFDAVAEIHEYPGALSDEWLAHRYRIVMGLSPDVEVTVLRVPEDPTRAYVYRAGSFVRLDGGELVYTWWSAKRLRWRVRAWRAWGWLRYGWRWW